LVIRQYYDRQTAERRARNARRLDETFDELDAREDDAA
jgi:hypothetical protein